MARLGAQIEPSIILDVIGQNTLRWIDDNFTSAGGNVGGWKPNAESTIKRKGSSAPLVDTGRLRQSFTAEIFGDTLVVGTNVEYAPPHEYGMSASVQVNGKVRIVNIPQRRMLPNEDEALDFTLPTINAMMEDAIGAG